MRKARILMSVLGALALVALFLLWLYAGWQEERAGHVEARSQEKAEFTLEPEILECHYITGEYDYMLKVTTTNTHTLEMIMNRIKGFHGIKRTQTNVILSTTKRLHSVSPVL